MTSRRNAAVLVVVLVASPLSSLVSAEPPADDPATSPTTMPAVTEATPTFLPPDEYALKRGADVLLSLMTQDANMPGLVVPLIKQRKVTGTKEVEMRFTKTTVPIYKEIRKPVEELVTVRKGYSVVIKRVVRQKVVKRIKIGEKEKLIPDPKGDIVKTVRKPVYGPGGPDIEPGAWLGNNAMALCALLEAGVSPAEHPHMRQMARTLADFVDQFGAPDTTWDIAWAVAALARFPGEVNERALKHLIGRLVSGQCRARAGLGMWGPVCVNPDHLAAVITEFAKVDLYAQRVAALSRQHHPEDPRVRKAKADLQAAQRMVAGLFRQVSTSGLRFSKATRPGLIQSAMGFPFPEVEAPGWPYNAFHETLADLQTTALAVYALRVADEHGKLPEAFPFKELTGITGNSLARPIRTDRALQQTLARLMAAHRPGKSWDEMIVWAKATEFSRIAENFTGPALDVPRSVTSREMPICNAQAAGAIEDLMVILDIPREGRYDKAVSQAWAMSIPDPNAPFALPPRQPRSQQYTLPYFRLCDPNTGGVIEPYDLILQLRFGSPSAETDPARRAALTRAIEFLVARQGENGQWACGDMLLPLSSPALREYYIHRVPQRIAETEARRKQLDAKKRKPLTAWHGMIGLAPSRHWYMSREQAQLRATIFAVLALGRIAGDAPAVEDQ